MTNRNIIKGLTLLAACSAFTAQAGVTYTPAPAPPPVMTTDSPWSGSVSLGYDTDYIYRGVEVFGTGIDGRAEDLVTGALDVNYVINDQWTWNFNAWYGSSANSGTNYEELRLYTKLLYKVNDQFSFGPSFKYYYFPTFSPGSFDEQFEPGIEAVWLPCRNTTVNAGVFYETEAEQLYVELGVNYLWKINDMFSLVPGALISYVDRDNGMWGGTPSDFNHAAIYLKAPITLKSNVTLTPYVAVNFPLDGVDATTDGFGLGRQDEEFYGGAVLSVGF